MRRRIVVCSLLSAFLLVSSLADAARKDSPEPILVQTVADSVYAESGGNSMAAISVMVTSDRGEPLADLGESIGDGTGAITLPAGWTLRTPHVAVGGCLLTPTAFLNGGFDGTPGAYLIIVIPFTSNPDCTWKSGEYHYVVGFDTSSPENLGMQGYGLGKLTVP